MKAEYIYNDYNDLERTILNYKLDSIFLVCGGSFDRLVFAGNFFDILRKNNISLIKFSDFSPNPTYESVVSGVAAFKASGAGIIIAVGGGSAIDVAKCIKLYSNLDSSVNYLKQSIIGNSIPLIAVPTTAGTGSEATKFAVIYYNNEKQSVTHESIIPQVVFFAPESLASLPEYHKKAAVMDALSHAVESFWSINATEESRKYSQQAIQLIRKTLKGYFDDNPDCNIKMLEAANYAGKAINITQTTAGHAMCYKITSLLGYAHGHSAALCNAVLWPYMVEHAGDNLKKIFIELAKCFGRDNAIDGARAFIDIIHNMDLDIPISLDETLIMKLAESVNPVRLKNNPIELKKEVIKDLYRQIKCI